MMMTFGKSIYYDFCVFNSWSYIFIFLMVCCTSVSQVTHLRFDSSTFFCPCSALSVSQIHSIAQPCLTLCNPMDCSMPSFPVLHHLLELAQAHVCWIGDAIQPFHLPLSSPLPALYLSQHQGLFQWVSSSHHVTKYWSFSFSISSSNEYSGLISFRIDWSPCGPRDSQASSPTPQFKSINSLALSFLYSPTLTPIHDYWKNHSFE